MKKQLILALAAVFTGLAGVTPVAQAADGTITFNGEVTATTCLINGSVSPANLTVTLPTVSTSALGVAGATAGDTGFTLALTGCSASGQGVTTHFEAGTHVDVATGRLNNTSGSAPEVQIQLLNAQGGVIKVGASAVQQNAGTPVTITGGSATMNYTARYYANGAAATPGTVTTSVTYTVAYQ